MDSCIDNELQYEYTIDKENEELIKQGLDKLKVDYEKLSHDLISELDDIHASYLFHPQARVALKEICLRISATKTDLVNNSWKDLAAQLGISSLEIACIENSKFIDNTELVLITFCQKRESTLAQLVSAFEKLQRYDALSIAAKYFPSLCEYVRKTHNDANIISNNDFNIAVNKVEQILNEKLKLMLPEGYPNLLSSQLPISLREINVNYALSTIRNKIDKKDIADQFLRRIEKLQPLTAAPLPPKDNTPKVDGEKSQNKKGKLYGKKVMLTFASDGIELARNIARSFRLPREIEIDGKTKQLLPTGVLILDDHFDKVQQNPEHFITHQFAKMDFIIPILTEGYMKHLCLPTNLHDSVSLDERYIKLIHDLMSNYYTDNYCINDKFRCIIPRQCKEQIFNHQHFKIDPVYRVYCYDDTNDIEQLCLRVASAKKK